MGTTFIMISFANFTGMSFLNKELLKLHEKENTP
jgi:hypothetical protein